MDNEKRFVPQKAEGESHRVTSADIDSIIADRELFAEDFPFEGKFKVTTYAGEKQLEPKETKEIQGLKAALTIASEEPAWIEPLDTAKDGTKWAGFSAGNLFDKYLGEDQ